MALKLTLRQLEIFVAVAVTGSTIAAAERLPLSQSATSAALTELEHSLGTTLFDRAGKRLVLNDTGRGLLPLARSLLEGAVAVEADFGQDVGAGAGPRRGRGVELRVRASSTIGNYVLPKLLARRARADAAVLIDLRIGNTEDVRRGVMDFTADFGFVEGPIHDVNLTVIPWMVDELVIVAAAGHPSSARAVDRRALGRERWLLREPGSGTREVVENGLLSHLPGMREVVTLGGSEAIKNAVSEGLGISCLSRWVVDDLLQAKRLCIVKTRLPRLTRQLSMVHRREKVLSASLRGFVEHCRAFARDRAAMREK